MRIQSVLPVLIIVFPLFSYSQNQIPVNLYTGSPDVRVSLGTIGGHGLSDNIYLRYDTKGLTLNNRAGYFGLGWNLSAGGTITREVRGLPDDFQGSGPDMRRGWFYDQNNVSTGNFGNSSDNSAVTCTDEITDYNYINSLGYTKDTEPDIFHYTIPGYSGSFVFDNGATPSIRLIPFEDIKIDIKYVVGTKTVDGFVITTNNGNRYIFNTFSTETKYTIPSPLPNYPQTVEFEKTEFELYWKKSNQPAVNYRYEWVLDSVKAQNSGYLYYVYDNVLEKEFNPLYSVKYNLYVSSYRYAIDSKHTEKKLKAVYSSSGMEVLLEYSENYGTSNSLLSTVIHNDKRRTEGSSFVKKYSISYKRYYPCPQGCDESEDGSGAVEPTFNWAFVRSIVEESTCSRIPPYKFTYITPQKYPYPIQPNFDAWGYYNFSNAPGKIYIYPQLSAQEQYRIFPISNYAGEKYEMSMRSFLPVEDSTKIGALKTIVFPSGGSATLDFELNEFYDPIAQETYKAGGLRVKRITYSDGLDDQKNIVTNYNYNGSNGLTSGKLLVHPKYIILTDEEAIGYNPVTYKSYQRMLELSENPWTSLTRRSFVNLAGNENSVVYAMGKVARAGQGYSVTEFSLPAAWGESSNEEWSASTVKLARSSACNTMDFIKTGTFNIYPYPPNPIYSYAQGLILSNRQYSEHGILVQETLYTYRDLYKSNSNAYKVWGLKYEKVPYWTDGYLFSKYFLLTDAKKTLLSQTTKEYDVNNPAKFVTTVQSYFYESATHKLVSRVEQLNTDGSRYTTRYKYPLDFGTISSGANEPALMIKKLQENYRNGTPLETYTTVTQVGGAEKTISAGISILNSFGGTQPLIKYALSLKPMEISNFIPSSIQSNQLTVDTRYDTVSTVLSYLPYFIPASSKGDSRITMGNVVGYNNTATVAEVSNAAPEQIAFSDFETTTARAFDIAGTLVTGTPRSGLKSIHPTVMLSKVVKKGNDKYFFSGWLLKKQPCSLTIYVKDITKTQTYYKQVFNFNGGGSVFEYFEYTFPIDASLSDFVVEIQGTVPNAPADPKLMPLLDDLAVYPANAELKTNTYSHPFGITATTNREQTGYVTYDDLGRVLIKKDKDGNIRERNTYYYPGMIAPVFMAFFSVQSSAPVGTPITFLAQSQVCLEGITYQWDFGQGYVNGTQSMSYTFSSLGSKTVKLKIMHPMEGVSEYSAVLDVVITPEQTAYFSNSRPPATGGVVSFTARDNSSLGSSVIYEWDFGQGYVAGTRQIERSITVTQWVYLRVSSNNPAIPTQIYRNKIIITNPDPR